MTRRGLAGPFSEQGREKSLVQSVFNTVLVTLDILKRPNLAVLQVLADSHDGIVPTGRECEHL